MRLAIGRSGIATLKREGDGATPRCRLIPLALFCARAPGAPIPWRPTRAEDGWCDAPGSRAYNSYVRLPVAVSHERLTREDGLYEHILVTDHNQRPRVAGAGSAIFIHVARPHLSPTEGCLAFPRPLWQRGRVPFAPFLVGTDPRPVR